MSSLAEEVENPKRDMPLGIIGSLAISSGLYVAVALVVTGMLPFPMVCMSVCVHACVRVCVCSFVIVRARACVRVFWHHLLDGHLISSALYVAVALVVTGMLPFPMVMLFV